MHAQQPAALVNTQSSGAEAEDGGSQKPRTGMELTHLWSVAD